MDHSHDAPENAPGAAASDPPGVRAGFCGCLLAPVLLATACFAGCWLVQLSPFVAVEVTTRNVDPAEPVADLLIQACGQTRHTASLAAGQSVSMRVHGNAECTVRMSYRSADGSVQDPKEYGYIEGDYVGTMAFEIDRNGLRLVQYDVHPWWSHGRATERGAAPPEPRKEDGQ